MGTGTRRCPFSRSTISIALIDGNQDVIRVAIATTLRFGSASYAYVQKLKSNNYLPFCNEFKKSISLPCFRHQTFRTFHEQVDVSHDSSLEMSSFVIFVCYPLPILPIQLAYHESL